MIPYIIYIILYILYIVYYVLFIILYYIMYIFISWQAASCHFSETPKIPCQEAAPYSVGQVVHITAGPSAGRALRIAKQVEGGHNGDSEVMLKYGSIPINTIFRGMNIHSYFDVNYRGTRFWHTAMLK